MIARMTWVIVGLGNPAEEYDGTRHNTGRMALDLFAEKMKFGAWKVDTKANAHVVSGMVGKQTVVCIAPDTYMNKSGVAVARFVKSAKAAERLIVLYDDLDLPVGSLKLSFDRGSGGHRGLESIIRSVKTKKFTRIRIGIAPTTPSGKLKKPSGDKEVNDFILGEFKRTEWERIYKVYDQVKEAIVVIIDEGRDIAMNKFN